MTDKFDLRKYLVESRVTTNSRLLNESKTYVVDTQRDDYIDFIDEVNSYLMISVDDLLDAPVDFESIITLVSKHGSLLFEIEIVGLDTAADGIESYYSVTAQDAIKEIAQLYTQKEEYYELATRIQNGETTGFMVWTPEFLDTTVVIPLEPGFERIETEVKRYLKK